MPRFADGVIKFQRDVYPNQQELFESLSHGQAPEALFITCSDSRIETAMITQTRPGDLFIVRNAGNIVPPHTHHTGGTTASIEFAVKGLRVPHIVICGHTECGAMKGALSPDALDDLPHIREWLGYAKAAVDVVKDYAAQNPDTDILDMLLEQNVILQLHHLRTHPSVAVALANADIQLHGWVYDIRTGGVRAYDAAANRFVPFENAYAEQVAEALSDHGCQHAHAP